MSRPQNISPLQVLYQSFPDAVRFVHGQITRVRTIVSARGDREDALSGLVRRSLARRILVELERRHVHDAVRAARRAARRAAARGGTAAVPPQAEPELVLPDGFEDFLEDGSAEEVASGVITGEPPPPGLPVEGDISLIEVDEDAVVRTRVFPRTVHCQRCGHFFLLDPKNVPPTLGCPCCRQGMVRVEPIIFVCGRCGDMRELVPPLDRRGEMRRPGVAEHALGAATGCPDCGRGHVHLEKHGTNQVARWEWRCTARCGYQIVLQERCLRCALPSAGMAQGSVIFMNALPASAPNALQSLVHQEMYVKNQPVDPVTLLIAAREAVTRRVADAFLIDVAGREQAPSDCLDGEALATLDAACIARAFMVGDVSAVTVAYGYKPGSAATHPQSRVAPDERLATLFSDPEGYVRFRAFSHSTLGNALVLQLDPVRVLERLDALAPGISAAGTLENVLAHEAQLIATREVRDLLTTEGSALLAYRALHAVEHALLNAAMRQLGSETLGSRLFPAAATVVLFEKSAIGRGGVIQLVNGGAGMLQLVEAARDLTLGCAQGCGDGCPTCAYVARDQYCAHPLDELGAAWLPANILLSRRGAAAILSAEDAH